MINGVKWLALNITHIHARTTLSFAKLMISFGLLLVNGRWQHQLNWTVGDKTILHVNRLELMKREADGSCGRTIMHRTGENGVSDILMKVDGSIHVATTNHNVKSENWKLRSDNIFVTCFEASLNAIKKNIKQNVYFCIVIEKDSNIPSVHDRRVTLTTDLTMSQHSTWKWFFVAENLL